MRNAGITALAAGLAHVPLLTSLGVSGSRMDDACVAALAAGRVHVPHLERLVSARTPMTAADRVAIFAAAPAGCVVE